MKRWIKWTSYSLISIVVMLSGLFIWACYTSSGLNAILRIAKPILAKQHIIIKWQQLSGAVNDLSVKTLSLTFSGTSVHIEKLHLAWSPWQIISNTVHIQQLSAQFINIKVAPTTQNPKAVQRNHQPSNQLPNIPSISIDAIDLPEIALDLNDNELIGKVQYQRAQQTWHFALHGSYRFDSQNQDSDSLLIQLESQGNQKQGKTQLHLHSANFGLDYLSDGQPHNHTWQESLSMLNLITPYGTWRLAKPVTWSLTTNHIHIPDTCVHNHNSNLCLNGTYTPEQAHLHVYSNSIDFNDWQNTSQFARLNGNGMIDNQLWYQNGKISGYSTLSIKNLNVTPNNASSVFDKTNYLSIQQLSWHLKLNQHQAQGQLNVNFDPKDQIHAQISLSKLLQDQLGQIDTKLTANVANLGVFNYIIPYVDALEGHLKGQFHIKGAIAKPQITGTLQLSQGQAAIPILGVRLKDIDFHLKSHQKNRFSFALNAISDPGKLKVNGNIDMRHRDTEMDIQAVGKSFTAISTPALAMQISPNLSYRQAQHQKYINGSVAIPKAHANLDLFKSSTQPNEDIVFVNSQGQPIEQQEALPIHMRLNVVLGKDITLRGYGISTHVKGALEIIGNPEQATVGNGRLTLDQGQYQLYGKSFTISQGVISFNQSVLSNPVLNITANYNLPPTGYTGLSQKLQIGVRIQGTAQHPKITLFSLPPLSQENILSYIILGRPIGDSQSTGQAALAQAALMFASQGGDTGLVGSVQSKLGIDELNFGTLAPNQPAALNANPNVNTGDNSDNTAVFIGKSFFHRFHITYGVGLFNDEQEVTGSYMITPSLKFSISNGNSQSGGDLLYIVDTN